MRLAGVICNRIGSPRHYDIVKNAVELRTGVPVLGYLPRSDGVSLPERHLGLVPAWEKANTEQPIRRITDLVRQHIDLYAVQRIAAGAEAFPAFRPRAFAPVRSMRPVRIGVARDNAFHFGSRRFIPSGIVAAARTYRTTRKRRTGNDRS